MRILLLLMFLAVPAPIFATLLNTYWLDSESELQYLFESGQIDLEKYLLLDELFSLPQYFDSLALSEILRSVEDLSGMDAVAIDSMIYEYEMRRQKTRILERLGMKFSYRYYQDFDRHRSSREYIYLTGTYDKSLECDFQLERSNDHRDLYFRRRKISFSRGKIRIDLGNFYPRWGEGITVGYHSRFLDKDNNRVYRSILYPRLGRYNGLHLSIENDEVSSELILSHDRTPDQNGSLAALNLAYNIGRCKVGLIASYHVLKNEQNNSDYQKIVTGAYCDYRLDPYRFRAEISEYEGSYYAYYMQISRGYPKGRFHLSAWNYPTGYINPYGSGRANSDYLSVEIEDTHIEYRSRQNGEYGFLLNNSLKLSNRIHVSSDLNFWRDGGAEEKLRGRWLARYELNRLLDLRFTFLWGDDNLSEDYGRRDHYRLDLIWRAYGKGYIRIGTEFKRVSYDYGRRDFMRIEASLRLPLTESISTSMKLSRVDLDMTDDEAGYWLIYLGEKLSLGKNLFLKATLDTREGKTYNLIESGRIILTMEFIS